ncbi:MAG: hypothetical protein U1E59_06335 [Amaricoccus sp.]
MERHVPSGGDRTLEGLAAADLDVAPKPEHIVDDERVEGDLQAPLNADVGDASGKATIPRSPIRNPSRYPTDRRKDAVIPIPIEKVMPPALERSEGRLCAAWARNRVTRGSWTKALTACASAGLTSMPQNSDPGPTRVVVRPAITSAAAARTSENSVAIGAKLDAKVAVIGKGGIDIVFDGRHAVPSRISLNVRIGRKRRIDDSTGRDGERVNRNGGHANGRSRFPGEAAMPRRVLPLLVSPTLTRRTIIKRSQ